MLSWRAKGDVAARGRGQRWGQNQNRRLNRQTGQTTSVPALGSSLETIPRAHLVEADTASDDQVQILDCQVVASFNWLERSNPSIIVPGSPPAWSPPIHPPRLSEDDGIFYRDRNACRYPDHPMEAAVEAVMEMNPDSTKILPKDSTVDIFGCASTLGNLLRFARGDPKPFRMLVEVVGGTVHLIRRENSPREIIPGIRGFGHTFPAAYTTWDASVRSSASHQRILSYHLGGLRCFVRFEGDGYLPDKVDSRQDTDESANAGNNRIAEDATTGAADTLASLASSLGISNVPSSDMQGPLSISTAGDPVPQKSIFDIKTRSIKRRSDQAKLLEEQMPRFWLTQVPNFVIGYHQSGVFADADIHVMDVGADILDWEREHASELRGFAALLRRIVQIARAREDGRMEITCEHGHLDSLRLRRQTPGVSSLLSREAMKRWRSWAPTPSNPTRVRADGPTTLESLVMAQYHSPSDAALDYAACDEECGYCGHCQD